MTNASEATSRLGKGLKFLLNNSLSRPPAKPARYRRSAQMMQFVTEPDPDLYYVAIIGEYRISEFFGRAAELQVSHGENLCFRILSEHPGVDFAKGLHGMAASLRTNVELWTIGRVAGKVTRLTFTGTANFRRRCEVQLRVPHVGECITGPSRDICQELVNVSDAVLFGSERHLHDHLDLTGKVVIDAEPANSLPVAAVAA